MGNLKIPDRFRPGLLALAKISEPAFGEIIAAAKRAPTSFSTNAEIAAWIASETPSISQSDVAKITDSLTSLYRLRLRSEIPVPQLAEDVTAAVREFLPDLNSGFEGRLLSFLPLDVLNVASAKAKELQGEGERTFCGAKILTDVRPVFGEVVGKSPTGAIIVHTLKIGFHESISPPSHREIFISLDSKDIVELRRILERAEEKEKSLKSVIDAAQLRLIELQ